MDTERNYDAIHKVWVELGWLQPGQPYHQAQIPEEILLNHPAIAEILQHASSPFSQAWEKGAGGMRAHRPEHTTASAPTAIPSSQSPTPPGTPAHPTVVRSSSFEVPPGTGHRAPNTRHRPPGTPAHPTVAQSSSFAVPPGTEHRAPSTGHRPPATPAPTPPVSTPEPPDPAIPEPETTPSPHKKLRRRKHCRGITKAGNPCYAYKMWGGDLCVFHNAKAINEREWHQAAQQFDPGTIAEAKSTAVDLDLLPVTITDNGSFLAIAEGFFRLAISGAIPERILSHLRHILRMVQRALPGREESRAAPSPEEHRERVQHVIEAAPAIRERLDNHDLRRRDLDNEDAGRKREAILKANQKYAPPPKQPSPSLASLRSMLRY